MSQSNGVRREVDAAPAPQAQSFELRPLPGPVNAESIGLDLSRELTAADFAWVHKAHLDHHLLVSRDQHITPRQHIDFSRRFGRLMMQVLHHIYGHRWQPRDLVFCNSRSRRAVRRIIRVASCAARGLQAIGHSDNKRRIGSSLLIHKEHHALVF